MNTNKVLCATVATIVIAFLSIVICSCDNNSNKTSEQNSSSDREENSEVEICDSKEKLKELFRMDFNYIEITDVQYTRPNGKSTELYIFCSVSDDVLQYTEFQEYEIYPSDMYIGNVLNGIADIKTANIKKCAVKFADCKIYDEVLNENMFTTRLIEWFQFDRSIDDRGNVIIYTCFPYEIIINVDKIMQDF